MSYTRVQNGQVTQVGLPTTGVINGQAVSNYNLLPSEVLQSEGWLPLVENMPVYNAEIEYVEFSNYEIQESRVIAHYIVIQKPIIEPSIEERTSTIEDVLMEILNMLGGE